MKKYADVFVNSFSIVKITFTGNSATDENFVYYLNELKQLYQPKEKIAIIFDAEKAVFPSIKYQKIQARWLKENEELLKTYCTGTAYFIPNVLIRNVLKGIFKYQEQSIPYIVCKNIIEAKIWTFDRLKNS